MSKRRIGSSDDDVFFYLQQMTEAENDQAARKGSGVSREQR